MPVFSNLGSRNTVSSREAPRSLRPEVQQNLPVLDGQALTQDRVVQDTFVNNTSFNEDSFHDKKSWAAGFPEGRIIHVTYFAQNSPITDTVSKVADINMNTLDDVHLSWTQIRQMELRCSSEISFDFDEDSNTSNINSEVIFLPGFVPRVGDIILYGVRNGRVGVFYISSVKRLALGHDTYHSSGIIMQRWLDDKLRDRLQRQSSSIMYFDKEKFVVGNTAMLSTEGYINQKELKHIRQEIIQDYVNRFYSTNMSSFMRPDDVYDPYIVEYWLRKVSITDSNIRPTQLLMAMSNFDKTIWSVLTNNPIKSFKRLARDFTTEIFSSTFWGTNVTSLLGHKFLTVGDEAAAQKSGLFDADGNLLLKDQYPFGLYNRSPFKEMSERLSAQQMRENRIKFYGGHLPFRTCAPHQHNVKDQPHRPPNESCEPGFHGVCHYKQKLERPPFPILSSEELLHIWMRINKISEDTPLSPEQQAEARGYIEWYRKTHPGTLSKKELDFMWRKKVDIPASQELSEEQENDLKEFIKSYRSKFLPILYDRELEMTWRTKRRIPYDLHLDPEGEEMKQLFMFILGYREWHGHPPYDDGIDYELPIIGSPISKEELEKAGAVVYSDTVFIDAMSVTEFISALDEKLPGRPPSPIPDDHVPLIYHQKHPLPHAHIHCHSMCHDKCGIGGTNDPMKDAPEVNKTPSYCLTNAFYDGSLAMNDFERLVYNCVTGKDINPGKILEAVAIYMDLEDTDAFYRHLLSIYLIDKALFWLRYHS